MGYFISRVYLCAGCVLIADIEKKKKKKKKKSDKSAHRYSMSRAFAVCS